MDSPKKANPEGEPSSQVRPYGIALGTNLGDRLAQLQAAREQMLAALPQAELTACSSVWETPPVDCPPGSPHFLNAVIEIRCSAAPKQVLTICQGIEQQHGREAEDTRERNAPRPIDLDILYSGEITIDTPDLTIPHPRIADRLFVLTPLAEIRPDLLLPRQEDRVRLLLEHLKTEEEPPNLHSKHW